MHGTKSLAREENKYGDGGSSKSFWTSKLRSVKAMPNNAFLQIGARLLPPDICARIGTGTMPSSEIAYHLSVLIADCEALNDNEKSMWTERRLSKQMVALAGLVLLVFGTKGVGWGGESVTGQS
jgi:hypothetical protein